MKTRTKGTMRPTRSSESRATRPLAARNTRTATTLASPRIHTIAHTTSRCVTSMRGPGVRPRMTKAPSRMAMPELPGIPKATVGMSAPPSLAWFALSGAITPSIAPLPKASGRLPVADPGGRVAAQSRDEPDEGAQEAAADRQPRMASHVPETLKHARERVGGGLPLRGGRDGAPAPAQLDHLGQPEQADDDGHQVHPVPEPELPPREPVDPCLWVHPHGGQGEPHGTGEEPLEERLAADGRDEGDAHDGDGEHLGGAEGQDDRADHGDEDGHEEVPDDPAEEGGSEGGSHRPSRLALLGQRMPGRDGGSAGACARRAEEDGRQGPARVDHRVHAEEEGEAGGGGHAEHEGDHEGKAEVSAEPRDGAEQHPDGDGEEDQADGRPGQRQEEPVPEGRQHGRPQSRMSSRNQWSGISVPRPRSWARRKTYPATAANWSPCVPTARKRVMSPGRLRPGWRPVRRSARETGAGGGTRLFSGIRERSSGRPATKAAIPPSGHSSPGTGVPAGIVSRPSWATTSARARSRSSTSRRVTQVTWEPGLSQSGSKVGWVASVAVITRSAPSTAPRAESAATTGTPSRLDISEAKRHLLETVGL